ncbi:sushi, von Willebrand factor type A, EGF and pentraxin domain-containing protein 1 isoform X2 [Cotesia glomerata]|nr:sushi, von Willebrand factor type A, EGF and pentraxin domain-containing protein 1 isoform X2 [Cotesia glomerata]XP_044588527.1 sushi, von Willebrand factor type A, EGF and pentraxin domain-containing protein 1 isoform X2 [Cotesia glomerata]XP_044588528.1 sushi, von Willebrand factor type A, EGF and pentraxin domain-containing protein 1 isoform X2 [Cotesia glomerata]
MNSKVSLSNDSLSAGTLATYTCDAGYELFGQPTTTCSSRGRWQGELPFCGTNVGFRKPANQSTTVRGGDASHGNDGDTGTEHDGKRCTETQNEPSPWWKVDLLKAYSVKVVRVTTRGCCGHQPLQDIEIRVGNSSVELQRNPLCAWFPGTIEEGITKTFICARALVGQYVFLQLVGVEGSLSLCEVEVFATNEFSIDRCAHAGTPADADIAAFDSTCYEFIVTKGGSFHDARNYCKSRSGDLVHGFKGVSSTFILNNLEKRKDKLKTQLVWIGAQKEPSITARTWRWVDGEIVQKPSWGKDQPNNYNGEQNCVVLDGGRSWLWNDVGCNLDYLHWICQSKPSSCGSPDKYENTTIIGTKKAIGSVIQYVCPDGYMLIGNESRVCEVDGFWSGKPPTCKYVDCGTLPELDNGEVKLVNKRTTYGAIADYGCKDNYTLVGDTSRRCGDGGIWSGHQPKCLFDWCPEPPEINGGLVIKTGKRAGSTATYTCQNGFILFGDNVLTCNVGGGWSGKGPQCKFIDCGAPAQIEYGEVNLLNKTTTVGSITVYTCQDDYWLVGEARHECTKDGKWSHKAPSCELITCEEPEVPDGSYVVGYDLNIHSTIEYHCEAGHLLNGEAKHVCQKNGEWSGLVPACEYIDCGKVLPVLNGAVDYVNETTHLGSEITYSCTKNYRLNGITRRYCLDNGQWSDATPKCEEIRCPEPILAEHGILSVTGNDRMYGRTLVRTGTAENSNTGATSYKIGALAKYRCERGYKVVGEPLSTCEDNGKWSGEVPQCIFVDCGKPDSILHGEYTLTSNATYYGAAALYVCDSNYDLDGFARRLCLENGTWSSETPTCREIRCQDLEQVSPLSIQVSTHSIGGVALYSCPRGYYMEGNETRVCLQNGSWSGFIPACFAMDCKHPGSIENGRIIVVNGSTLYGGAAEYHCLPLFERVGPFLRKCLDTGIWSGEEPRCEMISNEIAEAQGVGTSVGIGAGVIIFILLILGLVYLRLRKATPVKNTENIQAAERKEDQNAAVMSYSSLNDGTSNRMYENVPEDGLYDSPYSGSGSTYGYSRQNGRTYNRSGYYEAEPPPRNGITINGVTVR